MLSDREQVLIDRYTRDSDEHASGRDAVAISEHFGLAVDPRDLDVRQRSVEMLRKHGIRINPELGAERVGMRVESRGIGSGEAAQAGKRALAVFAQVENQVAHRPPAGGVKQGA